MTSTSSFGEFQSQLIAVVVTYGDRRNLASGAINSARDAGVRSMVLVINGCSDNVARELAEIGATAFNENLVVKRLHSNLGSAGGFSVGLSAALQLGASYVWLLDDDSEIEALALRNLYAYGTRIPEPWALNSFRPKSAQQRAALHNGRANFAPRGSFMYLDLISHFLRKANGKPTSGNFGNDAGVPTPYGPYGGLLVARSVIETVGLPRAELKLYEDDTEFTSRIVMAGIPLHLVASSRVGDADAKWNDIARRVSGPAALLLGQDSFRRYYSVRNRVLFDWSYARTPLQVVRFVFNMLVYVAVLTLVAARYKRWSQLREVFAAMRAASRGDLTGGPSLPD